MRRLKITIGILASVLFANCSEFLDETPDNRTEINSTKKVGELLALAYPKATFYEFANVMSDNAYDSEKVDYMNVNNTEAFFWETIRSESQDTPTEYWNSCYTAISQANTALRAIEEMEPVIEKDGNTKELKTLRGYKAEALFARAYAHFMLVNLYGKSYNPETASSDLGVTYIEHVEIELNAKYTRNTVQEVYDKIESDITEGMKYIGNLERPATTKGYHFGKESARAFATRFYIYKGDFNTALEYSNDINVSGSNIRNYDELDELSFEAKGVRYASPDEPSNLLVSAVMSNLAFTGGARYNFVSEVANDYLFSDKSNSLNGNWNYGGLSYTGSKMFLGFPKFVRGFEVTDPTNQTGYRYTNTVLFSNDLFYLDRIEALIGVNDLTQALSMIDTFVRIRTSSPSRAKISNKKIIDYVATAQVDPFYASSMSTDQIKYLNYLADLRRRDSYLEGLRWFDVKRYNIEVTHKNTYGTTREETLTRNDLRREIQIPEMAIANGVAPNPR